MKLENKFIFVPVVILLIILIVVTIFISSYVLNKIFIPLEDAQVVKTINTLNRGIIGELSLINLIITDWAHWDDTYIFSEDLNSEYKDTNFQEGYLDTLGLDFIIFLNKTGDSFFIYTLEENGSNSFSFENFEYEYLRKELESALETQEDVQGLMKLKDKFILFSLAEITMSDGSGAEGNYLFGGIYLDEEFIEGFMESNNIPLDTYSYEMFNFTDFIVGEGYYLDEHPDTLDIYVVINDSNNEPAAVLKTSMLRDVFIEGVRSIKLFLLSALLFVVLVAAGSKAFGKFLFRKIVVQINYLQSCAEETAKGNYDFKQIKSDDELGKLSASFVRMAEQIKLTNADIDKLNKKLESEVKIQTEELSAKVEELEKTKLAVYNIMDDLRESNTQLKQIDIAKSEFLNIVSHELKTPLTALVAHLDVLDDLKGNLSEQELHSLEAIRRNASNLRLLIGNILEISRMESGKFELTKNKMDIKKIIIDVTENLKILSKQKNIEIINEIGDLPEFEFDDTRMKEVLNNLLTNALKFTEKGVITVKAERIDNFVKVSVKDTGIGIPQSKLKNLFTKFYQVDASISRRYGGTGLGLSISKKIVDAHGGEMSVESKEGEGTTFSFTLPL